MNLREVKKVEIGDLVFYFVYSNRALLYHLNRTNKEPDNPEIMIHYFYDLAKAGARAENKEFNYSYDEFFDAIDPFPDAMQKLNDAVIALFSDDKKKSKEAK